jgi:diguanylate cyclase (GGDEF)-like protein/PAS domain S-box-containing protein
MEGKFPVSVAAQFASAANAAGKFKRRIGGPVWLTVVCGVLLSVIVVSGGSFFLYNVHNRIRTVYERNLASNATILAKQIEQFFTTVENVQTGIIKDTAPLMARGLDGELLLSRHVVYLKLRDKAAGMPYVGSLTIINAQGRLINFSRRWPTPNINAADRDFFKAFQSNPSLTSFIGRPIRNRATGSWVIQLTRKISGPNSEFLGVTTAAVELQYLQNYLGEFSLDPDNAVTLFRQDGVVLARFPQNDSIIGRRFASEAGLKLVATSANGVGLGAGVLNHDSRMVAAHRVAGFPIVVTTSKTNAAIYAGWRQTVAYVIAISVLTIIAIVAFASLFIRLFENYKALVQVRAEREKAEQLREQSRRFDVALNNMTQGLVMFDASERVVVCNQRYIEISGLSAEFTQPGRTLREILQIRQAQGSFWQDIEEYRRELLQDMANGKTKSLVIETDDGRSCKVVNVPMRGGGWVATHEDITEQVVAKKVIEKQKRQLDAALENMPQGLCMFDVSQRLIVCNKRYAELYGLNDEQTKPGTSLRAILEHRIERGTAPEDHENYIKDRINEVSLNQPYQVVNRLRDGRYVSIFHRPMPDGGWVATHEDVTEAKAREGSFRLLFKGNPVPMWVTDRESLRFIAVNEAAIRHYGYTRDQFMAMTLADLRPPADRERFAQQLHTLPDVQLTGNIRQHVKSDGTLIDVVIFSRTLVYAGQQARLAVIHDITKVTLAENELRRTKKFLDTVIEHVPVSIVVKDVAGLETDASGGQFTLFNRAYEELTGDSRTRLIGKTAYEIYPKERADIIVQSDNEALRSAEAVTNREHPILTSSNETRLVTAKKTVIRNDNGKPQYLLTVLEDVTERRRAAQHISYLAYIDPLTDLPNRTTFIEYLAEALDRASKSGEQLTVLCLDLDRFKEANDVYGHLVGDGLLCEAARRLQTAAAGTFLARVGGDAFTLIVTNGPQPETAKALAARLLAAFEDDFEIDGHRMQFGLSIGGAVYPSDGIDAKTLLANADAALSQVKAERRGSVRFFDAELGTRVHERHDLQNDLRAAFNRGELFLHYQPQQKISSKETIGLEALARWQCPKRGMVPPGVFIPIAEESSLIIPLSEWILREACREAASWPRPLKVAVNISPIQFCHGDLPGLVHSILLETGLAPDRLELEITEGVLIDDFSRAVSILARLKSLGVQIAMDDFGSGYSSLSYLHAFPFDKIKIDRIFVGNMEHNHHSMAIVRAIITLGHSLDVPILAEGVETEAQLAFLVQAGCDEVQGYLTGRPSAIEDYARVVGRRPAAKKKHAAAG